MVTLEEDVINNRSRIMGFFFLRNGGFHWRRSPLYCIVLYCIFLSSHKEVNHIQYIQDYQKVGF